MIATILQDLATAVLLGLFGLTALGTLVGGILYTLHAHSAEGREMGITTNDESKNH